MKILFICGSLEPGRDGVGDYTRRLSGELIRQGNETGIIAYNDRYISKIEEIIQISEGTKVKVLRVPSIFQTKQKIKYAGQFIEEFDPECLSLQYVPFAFQDKGLPFGLASQLKTLGQGRKWHIMFHELWVGMNIEAPIKHKLWGKVQKQLILKIIYRLSPKLIHTQTQIYQYQLKLAGFNAHILPLFGNIPVVKSSAQTQEKNILSLVVFGSIHPGAPIVQFANDLKLYQQNSQQKIQAQFIGRCGSELQYWVNTLNTAGIATIIWGEQPMQKISEVLQNSDWGVSSTPFFQIEKSGTVAAMREHSLPILDVARDWSPGCINFSMQFSDIQSYKVTELNLNMKEFKIEDKVHNLGNLVSKFHHILNSDL